MLKQQTILEVKRGERVYQLALSAESPLGELYDVLYEMRSFVVEKINAAQAVDKPKEPETTED